VTILARLILTALEKKSASYLDWNDAALGKAVKKLALEIRNYKGDDAITFTACATMLACATAQRNVVKSIIELEGVTEGLEDYGNWTIVISRS